jgi:hypothetical protein
MYGSGIETNHTTSPTSGHMISMHNVFLYQLRTFQGSTMSLKTKKVFILLVDMLEKELVREGEKLSDLLSMPVKDALGRELDVDYTSDIINVREVGLPTVFSKPIDITNITQPILKLKTDTQ